MGFKDCHFGQFATSNARYILSGDLIRLRNCSKLVESVLFAIIDLLLGAKSITLYFMFMWRHFFSFIFFQVNTAL